MIWFQAFDWRIIYFTIKFLSILPEYSKFMTQKRKYRHAFVSVYLIDFISSMRQRNKRKENFRKYISVKRS